MPVRDSCLDTAEVGWFEPAAAAAQPHQIDLDIAAAAVDDAPAALVLLGGSCRDLNPGTNASD